MNFQIAEMTVEYRNGFVFTDESHPRFGWKITANENGLLQQAYQIVVKESEKNGTVVWDSGKIMSEECFHIEYGGNALKAQTTYEWTVTVWDAENTKVCRSDMFETALVCETQAAWEGAQWIGNNEELPFYANTLAVYRVSCPIQIKKGSQRAGFLLGGDDPRLMDRNKNIMGVENRAGESYVLFVLDIEPLPKQNAMLKVIRSGYTKADNPTIPLYSLEISQTLINEQNRYKSHTIYLACEYGEFHVYIDGMAAENQLTKPESKEGWLADSNRLHLNPLGNGGNYTCFPCVCKAGFWLEEGQNAQFGKFKVQNYRRPNNTLFEGMLLTNQLTDLSHGKNNMLRTAFTVNKPVKKARIYATARGIYELYLNGKKVGTQYFAPGLSQYNCHQFYQVYDVTNQIQTGKNGFGAVLAEGWWSGAISYTGSNWNFFGDRNSLLAKLVLTYEDGTETVVTTNPKTWKRSMDGPVIAASLFQGEVRDTRLNFVLDSFSCAEFDDRNWKQAQTIPCDETTICTKIGNTVPFGQQDGNDFSQMKFRVQPEEGVQVTEILTAKKVLQPRQGVFVYDMGQNIAGIPRICIKGEKGQKVTLRFAEVLYPDMPEFAELSGMLMLENIRGAMAQDEFILNGTEQILQPSFTWHGFRYIEITGISQALAVENVMACAMSSLKEMTTLFTCSDPLVNRLYQNICWSLRDNFLSVPMDCPQRNERMGWSGDISVFSRTAVALSQSETFLRKHLYALRDTQEKGRFADIAPIGGGFGGILWGSAGITVVWELYLQYGDIRSLKEQYPAMQQYIEYLEKSKNEKGLITAGMLGDWLGPQLEQTQNAFLWQSYYLYDLQIMQKSAQALGYEEDHQKYQTCYREECKRYKELFFDPQTWETVYSGEKEATMSDNPFEPFERKGQREKTISGRWKMDTQTSYATALALGLLEDDESVTVCKLLNRTCGRENLGDDGTRYPPYTLMTGFIGTAWVSQALADGGYHQTAWNMLLQTTYPSWLYPVVNGATTIWERLNSYTKENGFGGNNSMNSFNHYSFGAVGAWMAGYAGGIRRANQPGTFMIAPTPERSGRVLWAQVQEETVQGTFFVRWEQKEEETRYQIHIPGGKKTKVKFLCESNETIFYEKEPLHENKFISQMIRERGTVAFTVSPGNYEFIVKH